VTVPSLYVFNALVGSRLTVAAVVRLLVATLGVIVAVLASLGPSRRVFLGEHDKLSVYRRFSQARNLPI